MLSAERMADFLPLLHPERFGLPALELPAVHLARPREPHGYELGQVAERLLHAGFALSVAVEEDGHNATTDLPGELGCFCRLLADGQRGRSSFRRCLTEATEFLGRFG